MAAGMPHISIARSLRHSTPSAAKKMLLANHGALQAAFYSMEPFRLRSAAEQVAAYLRTLTQRGEIRGVMPGVHRLAAEFGVHRTTVEAALRELERDGLLAARGVGRRRQIVTNAASRFAGRRLRVAILMHDPLRLNESWLIELQHLLNQAGHAAFFTEKSLLDLRMNVGRVARLVGRTEADAWIVGVASREVLEWFVDQEIPAFALFGRRRGLPVAAVGPDKPPVYAAITRRLIELGHRRIVLLAQRVRRLPKPGASEQAFLAELAAHGIEPHSYHLPDWEETINGFEARLEALFRITPPTALIIDEVPLWLSTLQFLGQRCLRVPQDISMVCTDGDRAFAWCKPAVAHIYWDSRPVIRRIVRWVNNVACGRQDLRQTLTKVNFVEGGTIGPAKK